MTPADLVLRHPPAGPSALAAADVAHLETVYQTHRDAAARARAAEVGEPVTVDRLEVDDLVILDGPPDVVWLVDTVGTGPAGWTAVRFAGAEHPTLLRDGWPVVRLPHDAGLPWPLTLRRGDPADRPARPFHLHHPPTEQEPTQ